MSASISPDKRVLTGRYRWVICFLLFLATTLNYTDRQILSVLKPILDDQLHWTNSEFGLVNSVFTGAYAAGLLGYGWLIDRWSLKWSYLLAVGVWSLAALGHVFIITLAGFCVARIALGLAESGNFPCAIKAVAEWFPLRERALATSLFNSGANVASVLVPAIIPVIAYSYGWQYSFVGPALAGGIWLILWYRIYASPRQTTSLSRTELDYIQSDVGSLPNQTANVPWLRLLGCRQAWAFIVAKFLTDPVWWFLLIWLPDFFNKTRGLDLKNSWMYLVEIYLIITILSIGGGWVTGYLISGGWSVTSARKTGLLGFAFLVLPVLVITRVDLAMVILIVGLAGAAHQAWSANLFTTVSDMFPSHAVGSVIGLGGMAGAIGGMLFPLFCGTILDYYQHIGNSTMGYAVLFGICGSAYLVAFTLHHLLAPSFRPLELSDRAVGT